MPFSDPMADGPAIQASSLRALQGGPHDARTLELVREFREPDHDTPIVLMGYYNPIYVYPRRSVSSTMRSPPASTGSSSSIVPPEADDELCLPATRAGLNFIRLATPTTDAKRLPAVLRNTSGFLYYVSITGITGTAAPDVTNVHTAGCTDQEIDSSSGCGRFWRKKAGAGARHGAGADGVVVGSALVTAIKNSLGDDGQHHWQDGPGSPRSGESPGCRLAGRLSPAATPR